MATRQRIESPFGSPAPPPEAAAASASARLGVRPLTGWEEEYVERHASEGNTARLCNEVLARCLVAPGEDPGAARETVRGLLVAERDRELVALRRLSLGPRVQATVRCQECDGESEAGFSLDVLPVDFEPPAAPVHVALKEGGEAILRLPTAGDQEDLVDAALDGEAERRSWLIGRCLLRYGERSGPFDADAARGLPVAVRRELEGAIEARLPELDLQMVVECSHCGAQIAAPFDVPTFFFSS